MTNSKADIDQEIFDYIAEVGNLMFMSRSHSRSLLNTFDTVASHAFHVGIIAYCIARMEKLSHQDGIKALAMGVLHDNAEMRTGDLDFIAKNYSVTNEAKAIKDQLKNIPFGKDLIEIFEEYEARKTLVSKCAKDADSLEQMYQEWVLMHTGNTMAKRWFEGSSIHRIPFLRTKSAKKLAKVMLKRHPHQWWWKDFVDKGINLEHLNSKK
ncbi:HD domain-containing protein [Candidatus Daviesbacteria bacterium]|nr:HD domain-containing protein [Candidatus Daviesbacteria bacterium]